MKPISELSLKLILAFSLPIGMGMTIGYLGMDYIIGTGIAFLLGGIFGGMAIEMFWKERI